MELKHLRTFVAAAQHESFTRAAASLKVTQAAVSQHVAALEREFDVRLFDRSGRRVHLTDYGRRFHGYARRILDLADEAVRELTASASGVQGTLTIAASTVPAESLLPELLTRFRERHPGVRERLLVSDSQGAAKAVESLQADLGFVGELPQSSSLEARPVADDDLVLVVSPQHRWAESGRATLQQLREEPLIVREPGSGSRHCIEQALEPRGLRLSDMKIVMEVNSNDSIRAAARRGAGAAFLSLTTAQSDIQNRQLVPVQIRSLRLRRQLYLIQRAGSAAASPIREFIAFVHSASRNG